MMTLTTTAKPQAESARARNHTVGATKRRVSSHPITTVEELIAAVGNAQRLKLITIKEVCERTCSGPSFIYGEAAAGRFPKPIKIGASKSRRAASRFVDSEVSDWIEQRIAERDANEKEAR
jgi:prophage regulatory protein